MDDRNSGGFGVAYVCETHRLAADADRALIFGIDSDRIFIGVDLPAPLSLSRLGAAAPVSSRRGRCPVRAGWRSWPIRKATVSEFGSNGGREMTGPVIDRCALLAGAAGAAMLLPLWPAPRAGARDHAIRHRATDATLADL